MSILSELKSWKNLESHFNQMKNFNMREQFDADTNRFSKFSISFNDILFDFSKNLINEETIGLLSDLAGECNLKSEIERMFAGEKINSTENRAVLHTALRNKSGNPVFVDGADVMQDIYRVKNQMRNFVEKIHNGEFRGYSGELISDVVNIGIGGSDLGPSMVCKALKPFAKKGINIHFVSNVDGAHIYETLKELNPSKTLFIIASKTFTTQETLTNAITAKEWFLEKSKGGVEAVANHFVALSTNEKAVVEFGINKENMFEFWDWVGGRYSLWSAIGLSIAIYLGMDNFELLLDGAYEADCHFRNEEFKTNIPVIMGLLGIWYANFHKAPTYAVIPYNQYLVDLPDFLQQLDMESNGKSVSINGEKLRCTSGPVIWGKPGTNAQHSFFQMIHQGTQMIPADFIASIHAENKLDNHQEILLSNFIAQTEALMKGKSEDEVIAELTLLGKNENEIKQIKNHKVFAGNKPTNTVLMNRLDPKSLGSLIAFYEHKVFVQGIIWGVNSFDQWGVELGKQLAKKVLEEIRSPEISKSHDASTNALINIIKQN